MNRLQKMIDTLPELRTAMVGACDWLVDIAQVKTDHLTVEGNVHLLNHSNWKGAIRGEYNVGVGRWNFFAPAWHTSQAVKALVQANQVDPSPKYIRGAKAGVDFILGNQVVGGDADGFIYAYELVPDNIYVSAILESIDGLLLYGETNGERSIVDAAIKAARWCRDHAWVRGEGLVRDLYDPRSGQFVEDDSVVTKDNVPGRPLADDAIFLKAFHRTGEEAYRDAFYEIINRLLKDENPSGNWVDYGPCRPDKGEIHPRHAYWWGLPMIDAWQDSGNERYLEAARRSGQWYIEAQRNDGGLFRYTDLNFKTDCFGHATSGIACAAILWTRLFQETGEEKWIEPIRKAMNYCIGMQFTNPQYPNLKGCILEKVNPPDGTDRSPYYIRDLGTIFFVQAAAQLFTACESNAGSDRRIEVTIPRRKARKPAAVG